MALLKSGLFRIRFRNNKTYLTANASLPAPVGLQGLRQVFAEGDPVFRQSRLLETGDEVAIELQNRGIDAKTGQETFAE